MTEKPAGCGKRVGWDLADGSASWTCGENEYLCEPCQTKLGCGEVITFDDKTLTTCGTVIGVLTAHPGCPDLRALCDDCKGKAAPKRCLVTGNPIGTDTHAIGGECRCANCSIEPSPSGITEEPERDSPPFVPQELKEFAGRGYVRLGRGITEEEVAGLLRRHSRLRSFNGQPDECEECTRKFRPPVFYPCPTVRLIEERRLFLAGRVVCQCGKDTAKVVNAQCYRCRNAMPSNGY